MTAFTIAPAHDEFGARLTGPDLKRPLTDALVEEIRDAIDAYSFLVFPGQHLQDDQQLALTRALG